MMRTRARMHAYTSRALAVHHPHTALRCAIRSLPARSDWEPKRCSECRSQLAAAARAPPQEHRAGRARRATATRGRHRRHAAGDAPPRAVPSTALPLSLKRLRQHAVKRSKRAAGKAATSIVPLPKHVLVSARRQQTDSGTRAQQQFNKKARACSEGDEIIALSRDWVRI